jgi:hypothetical protein
MLIIFS